MTDISRRHLLFTGGTLAALGQTSSGAGVPMRRLGKTGVRVSVLGVGGAHAGGMKDEAQAIRLMHAAIDEGITFFDNAWEYAGGRAEEVMGKALAMDGKRKGVFVMTKLCQPTYEGAMKNLEESLRKLQTDHVDLWQIHEMNNDNDPEWVFERGAVRALLEAKRQGKTRFIGFTGHKDPRIHMDMITRRFEGKPVAWDAAQMPINIMDAQFRSFQKTVVPECAKRGIGVVGMKGLGGGRGNLLKGGVTAEECIRWCLGVPIATQVLGFTTEEQVKQAAAIARSFQPMSDAERQTLLSRTREAAGDGRFELFKSTKMFDSRHHRVLHGFEPGLVG